MTNIDPEWTGLEEWESTDEKELEQEPEKQCDACDITESELGKELKRCAKCKQALYCDRHCQKADWKQHKKVCAMMAQVAANAEGAGNVGANTSAQSSSNKASSTSPGTKALKVAVSKPFHKLKAKTWLHDRPECDVFKLLIDSYRLKLDDTYKFDGDCDADSIYGGLSSSEPGFRQFLRKVEKKRGLLPPWWSREKAEECVQSGLKGGQQADLRCTVEKSDVVDEYGDPLMPMQMRMFVEAAYGRGPGGMSGAQMMQVQMMAESGEMQASCLSLANLSLR